MEGYRGTPQFKGNVDMDGNTATNSGTATAAADLTPLGQVSDEVSSWLTYNKPVGTIHITVNSANPSTYLGYGTWVAFGAGRVLISLDPGNADYDTAEETGNLQEGAGANVGYIVVYVWKRTA